MYIFKYVLKKIFKNIQPTLDNTPAIKAFVYTM